MYPKFLEQGLSSKLKPNDPRSFLSWVASSLHSSPYIWRSIISFSFTEMCKKTGNPWIDPGQGGVQAGCVQKIPAPLPQVSSHHSPHYPQDLPWRIGPNCSGSLIEVGEQEERRVRRQPAANWTFFTHFSTFLLFQLVTSSIAYSFKLFNFAIFQPFFVTQCFLLFDID